MLLFLREKKYKKIQNPRNLHVAWLIIDNDTPSPRIVSIPSPSILKGEKDQVKKKEDQRPGRPIHHMFLRRDPWAGPEIQVVLLAGFGTAKHEHEPFGSRGAPFGGTLTPLWSGVATLSVRSTATPPITETQVW